MIEKEQGMLMAADKLDQSADMQTLAQGAIIADTGLDERRWYILLIEPQQEVRSYTCLKSYGLKVYLPLIPCLTTRGVRRTKVTVYRPMMRGYLFVDEGSLAEGMMHIERMPAVHRFLQIGSRYATVPNGQMERVRHIEQELAKPKPFQSIWDVGEVVRINDGAFWGLSATIVDLANGERIRVEVSLLGRSVPMTVDSDILDKL
jgi:transcription antitermination factor NusG